MADLRDPLGGLFLRAALILTVMAVMAFIAAAFVHSFPFFGLAFGFLAIMASRAIPEKARRQRAVNDYLANRPGLRVAMATCRHANVFGLFLLVAALLWVAFRAANGVLPQRSDGALMTFAAAVVCVSQGIEGYCEYRALSHLRQKLP